MTPPICTHLTFARPVTGGYVSQWFGVPGDVYTLAGFAGHEGIDYGGLPVGTPVVATTTGTVKYAGDVGNNYGKHVVIAHDACESWYAHLDTIDVKPGQIIQQGERIGTLGATGRKKMYPHLHFGIRVLKLVGSNHPYKGFVDPAGYRYTHGV